MAVNFEDYSQVLIIDLLIIQGVHQRNYPVKEYGRYSDFADDYKWFTFKLEANMVVMMILLIRYYLGWNMITINKSQIDIIKLWATEEWLRDKNVSREWPLKCFWRDIQHSNSPKVPVNVLYRQSKMEI